MKQIEIKNLKFGYNENQILKNINLSLDEGDFAVISGKNGSGKSTLIKLILGELKKDKGIIKLFGIDMEDFKNFDKIGYVPQVNEAIKVAFPVSAREYVGLNLYKEFSIFNTITKKSKSKSPFLSSGIRTTSQSPSLKLTSTEWCSKGEIITSGKFLKFCKSSLARVAGGI